MPQIPIAGGYYESESAPLSAQRCINWIPVVPQIDGALNNRALIGSPGLVAFSTLEVGNRGGHVMDGVPYFVNGSTLYSVASTGVATSRGTIQAGGRVSMADNGQYLVIVVPGGPSYVYDNSAATLTVISDTDFRAASSVAFKDGYFVFSAFDGSVFFISALNDPLTYNALDFGAAEISPDDIVSVHVNHNELFVIGETTTELFQNIGGADFPFQRISGANIQKGSHARFGVVEYDNTFLFIGGGLNERTAIWRVSGSSSAVKISTAAIDQAIQEFTADEISGAFAWTYSERGSFFAGFTFEGASPSKTFVYDVTSSALSGKPVWHERQSGVVDGRWRVNSIVRAYGKLLVGDMSTATIGEIDRDTFTEYGEAIMRQRSSQPFFAEGLPVFSGELALTMESGVGLNTGQGSDPQIRLDWSDDGGRTFSSEFFRSYGGVGKYEVVPTWRRLGRFPQQRVLRFTTTEPVKSNLLRLDGTVEVGY